MAHNRIASFCSIFIFVDVTKIAFPIDCFEMSESVFFLVKMNWNAKKCELEGGESKGDKSLRWIHNEVPIHGEMNWLISYRQNIVVDFTSVFLLIEMSGIGRWRALHNKHTKNKNPKRINLVLFIYVLERSCWSNEYILISNFFFRNHSEGKEREREEKSTKLFLIIWKSELQNAMWCNVRKLFCISFAVLRLWPMTTKFAGWNRFGPIFICILMGRNEEGVVYHWDR